MTGQDGELGKLFAEIIDKVPDAQAWATPRHAPVPGLYGGNVASKASQFVVYPDAPHAFHVDCRPSYRKEATEEGLKRCLEWFKAYGVA